MEAVHSGIKGDVIDGSTGQPVQNAPLTNSYEKKSTAEMLLILTILNVISKQNTTNRVDKNDLV